MLTVAQLSRFLANVGGWPLADVEQRARRLREAGLLPTGGHGVNAPKITAHDAVTLLCGLAASDTQAAVLSATAEVLGLTHWNHAAFPLPEGSTAASLAGRNFADAFTAVLADGHRLGVDHVYIDRLQRRATIRFKSTDADGRPVEVNYTCEGRTAYGVIRNGVTYTAGFLDQLRLNLSDFAPDAGAAWKGDA